jgi:hypothetical protein
MSVFTDDAPNGVGRRALNQLLPASTKKRWQRKGDHSPRLIKEKAGSEKGTEQVFVCTGPQLWGEETREVREGCERRVEGKAEKKAPKKKKKKKTF